MRFTLATKLASESRVDVIDMSPAIQGPYGLNSATATCAVYSGTDPTPSAVIGAVTVNTLGYPYVNLTINAAGVLGVIYQITITCATNNGNVTATGFLAIVPDPL